MGTIYVSPTGSDTGTGSVSQPVLTLGYARTLAISGDTILVDGDTNTPYSESVLPKTGVTLKGAPGTRPCLDGNRTLASGIVTQVYTNLPNFKVEGFEIRNYLKAGIFLSGQQGQNHNVIINDCYIHHIYGDTSATQNGIYLGFGNTTVTNCEISHVGLGGEAMGIWMWRNHNAVIDRNLIYLCRKSCIRDGTGLLNTFTNNQLFASWCALECSVAVSALMANNVIGFSLHGAWLKHSNNQGLSAWGMTTASVTPPYRFWHNTIFRCYDSDLVIGGGVTDGGPTRDFDARNNIFVGGNHTAPNQSGQPDVTKRAQSYVYDAPTSRLDNCVLDFNCYTTDTSGFNRPLAAYRANSSLPYTLYELPAMETNLGWEANGQDLDPQLNDPLNLDFDYPDTSPVANMGVTLDSPWGNQMGARGLAAPRIRWEQKNMAGVSKTWSAGVWLGMFDQKSPSSSSWTITPGVDAVIIDLGSVTDITHLQQSPLSHNSVQNVRSHRWESANSTSGPWTTLIESSYKDFAAATHWEEIPGGGTQCRYLRFTFLTNFSSTGLTGTVGAIELGAAKLSFTSATPPSGGGEEPPDPPDPGPGGTPLTPTGDAYLGIREVAVVSVPSLDVGAGQTYATVQEAVAAAENGATVYVHAGTYARQTITEERSNYYVYVRPYPGDSPTIAGFTVDGGGYIDIGGFITTNINRVQNGAYLVKYHDCFATSTTSEYCFYVPTMCNNIYIEDNIITAPNQCGVGTTGAAGAVANWSHDIFVRGNSITGSNQDGMFIDGMENIYIEDNTIFDVARNANHNDGIQVTSCDGLYLRRNHIYDTRAAPANEYGSGIILEHANGNDDPLRLVQNIEVVSNLIHNWHGGGLTIDGTINSFFANNTVYNNFGQGTGDGFDCGIVPTDATYVNEGDFEMWNNIFGKLYRGSGALPTFMSNNHVEGSNGLTGATATTTGDPLFISTGPTGVYALQSGSACKTSGTTRTRTPALDVYGAAFGTIDRGAVSTT